VYKRQLLTPLILILRFSKLLMFLFYKYYFKNNFEITNSKHFAIFGLKF